MSLCIGTYRNRPIAEDQNLCKSVSLHYVVLHPPARSTFPGSSDLSCIKIKAAVQQVAHCAGAELTWASTPAIAKRFLLIHRGREKAVFREPRSGLGFGAAPQTQTGNLALHGPAHKG